MVVGTRVYVASRAAVVLYNFLVSNRRNGCYILPANCCPVVLAVFIKAKIKYEFFDLSDSDFCVNQGDVLQAITANPGKYSGILYIRSYGVLNCCDLFFDKIKALDPDLQIIDDRCLSFPVFCARSSFADLELYSTGYSKVVDLSQWGWGFVKDGFTYTQNLTEFKELDLSIMLDSARQYGLVGILENTESNWLGPIGCRETLPDVKLHVDRIINKVQRHKKKLNKIYSQYLPKSMQLNQSGQIWRFNIAVENRDAVLNGIFDLGLFASAHYKTIPVDGNFPVSRWLDSHVINLFNDFRFTESNAMDVSSWLVSNFDGA